MASRKTRFMHTACAHYQGNGRNGRLMYAYSVEMINSSVAKIKVWTVLAGWVICDPDGKYLSFNANGEPIPASEQTQEDFLFSVNLVVTSHFSG